MKNVKSTVCLLVVVLFMAASDFPPMAEASFYKWNNGGINTLTGSFDSGEVRNHTTLNILNGGTIDPGALEVYDTSIVNVSGNTAKVNILNAWANSEVSISNGTVGLYICDAYSHVSISGGMVRPGEGGTGAMYASDWSTLSISGGQFTGGFLCDGSARIVFSGRDFAIDGSPVAAGEYFLRDFTSTGLEVTRRLTGTLDSGESIDNNFSIYDYGDGNASITIIPEPATLLLLGLAAVILRKYRTE